MGNCIYLEKQTKCLLCQSELGKDYVYCAYCNKRFHPRCLIKQARGSNLCPYCNKPYLRLINRTTINENNI